MVEKGQTITSKKKFRPSGANSEMSEKDLNKLATELMRSISSLKELKKKVQQLSREGKVGGHQAGQLIRRWRIHDRQVNYLNKKNGILNQLSENLESCQGQTLDDVKRMVNEYVVEGKIARHDAGTIIKNWKRSEHRRVLRQLIKQKQRRCLYCRQRGHFYSQCPNKDEQTMGTGICFKCGSSEHTSAKCTRKNIKGYPYAICFVCKQQGHLSRDCDDNPNGIYPDGGSCDICGSQKHLKRDCPELKGQRKSAKETNILAMAGTAMNAGDEDVPIEGCDNGSTNPTTPMKKKSKTVRF